MRYLHQFFWDRYFNTTVIQVLTFVEPDSNGPGKKLQVIRAFRCSRVHWKPLHLGLQKLQAFVSPHANPKRYSGHGTSSESNASTRCCKAVWHWNQKAPRNSHRRGGYRHYIYARERRHRCCCDDRYLKRQQTAVFEIGDAKAGKRRPLWSPHPRVRIWEHIIWDLVPLRRLSEPWLRS